MRQTGCTSGVGAQGEGPHDGLSGGIVRSVGVRGGS